MTTACNKWSGLFSVGEDFDDQDLLEADWTHTLKAPSGSSADPSPSPLRDLPTSHSHSALQASEETSSWAPQNLPEPNAKSLRCLSNSNSSPSISVSYTSTAYLRAPVGVASSTPSVQPPSVHADPPSAICGASKRLPPPQDDFDDWDLDLEELEESETRWTSNAESSSTISNNVSPIKRLRPATAGQPNPTVASLGGFHATSPALVQQSSFSTSRPSTFGPRCNGRPSAPAPPRTPSAPFARTVPIGRFSSPVTPRFAGQTPQCTPRGPQHTPKSLFQAVSPAPTPMLTPRPLHTPVLTNHLVQLVSAANKTPQRPRKDAVRSKTRRFPGPAGLLPQQVSGRSLEDIVVTVPQTPAHGAVARIPSEVASSQSSEEEEFSGGAWAAMKAEMGLDERNPSCFLRSYSIVMVLRKAALRQLVKNKVPNMAVVLKSIVHTHTDAKAQFKDSTGEMQGTVHRRLLEERQAELKPGAVLLLKQVGVFSPSHRNHYLNVTPNNLLRIYPPDGVLHAATQLSQPAVGPVGLLQADTSRPVDGPVSQMQLLYDDEEEEEGQGNASTKSVASKNETVQPAPAPEQLEDAMWETDDLDELLGELPVDSYTT